MGKSSTTQFTIWTKELNLPLNIKMAGLVLPSNPTVKIVGVTFDGLLKFSHHAIILGGKIGQRNNILKELGRSGWGCSKEVLLTTYKAVGRSVLNYSAPIWTPILSDSRWKDLQRRQNSTIRTVIGCHTMASELHLHHQMKGMPVREHSEMLSPQFLLRAHLQGLPDHLPTTVAYRAKVWPTSPTRVPEVEPRKQSLPRKTWTTLCSGYSSILASYLSRIDGQG